MSYLILVTEFTSPRCRHWPGKTSFSFPRSSAPLIYSTAPFGWLVTCKKTLSWGRYFIPPRGLSVRRPSDCLRTVANRHGHTTVFPSPASERASGLSSTDRRSEAREKDCRRTRGRRGRRERSGELRRPAAAWRLSDGLFFPLGVLESRNR